MAEAPARVVSMNLCADQYALLLAGPGQLVSVSHVSRDTVASPYAALAAEVPVNHGGAEEIWLLRPDLVLAHEWSDTRVLAILRRLGIDVLQIPVPEAIAEIPDTVRAYGDALGQSATAELLATAFEQRLADLEFRAAALPPGKTATLYGANGYSAGMTGMAGDILRHAGLLPAGGALFAGGSVPLETLVMEAPDMIITGARYAGWSRSEALLDHPVFDALPAARRLSGPAWACGTPRVLDAVEALLAVREAS
ncbi:iron complex transport system substrate-binding protein [Poseidonocella pacifica]|uniref:Iron complex transport system substrate-binding protein n=1 Tax=Poseidonocella pacifica TaxID=871651 RepID=A0A1I0V470_9RHOB|nr:ABC transporter substrate-binding protein [Poseidonocella pacifica]SFA71124.1 iron complex transport system substrate-binding protein [Poseidonocella pacifica]